jgi:26S proteasome regulatory subunit N10
LALKHRQNKAQRQRIIIFTRSPILEDEKKLIKLAQKIKKNSISIDFVVFGEPNGKVENKLTAFNENVEGGARSHIAIILPQSGLLSDQLVTFPILNGDGGSGPSGMGDTSEGRYGREFEFGVDPSVDPELALALRMSIEEEKLRLEKQNKERAEAGAEEEAEAILPEIGEEDEESHSPLNKEAEAGGSRDSCSR